MSKQTVLLISPAILARVDLRGGKSPKVESVWVRPLVESGSLATLVDSALRLGKNRRRRVYVATTRCWSGVVSVGSELVYGATAEERLQTLTLEAEPYSGISAFDGAAAERPLPPAANGDARYWVTQISGGEMREIEQAVKNAGGRLLGVGHPAVPNVREALLAEESWRSLQTWEGTTFAAQGNGGAIADMLTMTSGLESDRTRQQLDAFFGNAGNAPESSPTLEWIGGERIPASLETLPAAENLRTVDLASDGDLGDWALAWTRVKQSDFGGLPTILVPKKPLSNEASLAISAVLGLTMLGACVAHFGYLKRQLADYDATIEEARKEGELLKSDQEHLKGLEKSLEEVVAKTESTREQELELQQQLSVAADIVHLSRVRWLNLVDAIVNVSEESSWVNEIQGEDGKVTLSGLAVSDAAVHRFASAISRSLQRNGWRALPADTEVDPDSELVRFKISLEARDASVKSAASATPAPQAMNLTRR